jgi:hypothetical protein
MLKEVIIAIIAGCCILSLMPIARLLPPIGGGFLISVMLFGAVLAYSIHHITKLQDKKEHRLIKIFSCLLVLSIVLSSVIVALTVQYWSYPAIA